MKTILFFHINSKHLNYIFPALFIIITHFSFSQNKRDIQHQFFSKSLQENRVIEIYTPIDYNISNHNYPVLFLLDGEYVFNYAKGSVDFLSNSFGFMPKMIVVSIPNTDRIRDLSVTFNPKDGYNKFIEFLEFEIIPFINKKYRSNGFNIIYGWSTASSLCTYLLLTKPEMFDGYILTGSGIGSRTSEYLKDMMPKHNYDNKYLYANTEGNSHRVAFLEKYKSVVDSLSPQKLNYKFDIATNETHVGVISKGLYDGLNFIFESFFIPEDIIKQGKNALISYYNLIDEKYDFNVRITEGGLIESASILYVNDPDEAISLLNYGLNIYPESEDLFGTIAEIYENMENYDKAKEYYKIAMKKSNQSLVNKIKYKSLHQKVNKK